MNIALDFFNNLDIRWQDFVDIAVLSYVIYRILLMLRGTRTIQILGGLLLVAVFFYAVDILKMIGSAFVLRNVFSSIVIVLVVLFQADIRNALAQIGTKTLFAGAKLRQSADLIEKVYSVCEYFAQSRIGALIVLENEMGLRSYYDEAIKIDAEFSPQLLVSLFNTQSPTHDGAVIISREGRIAYASSILPLSKEIDFSTNMGTRHRAALGLSQESDALTLVVSEETGKISMTFDGDLVTQSAEISLKAKVQDIFKKTHKSEKLSEA
jgi:diadenylate cyclase